MLDGLDRVDWPSLRHAYGSATDVPGQLRALASPDPDRRADALDELHGNIWHQGTVYEATASAVPFLVELLVSPATRDRAEIAILLGLIARGHAYDELRGPGTAAHVDREWATRARDAVRGALPALLDLLHDPDAEVRAAVVHAVAALETDAARIAPALESALARERHPRHRAVVGLGLALLGRVEGGAFVEDEGLPTARIARLAAATAAGDVGDREEVMEILLDLATDSFDAERLDDLGL